MSGRVPRGRQDAHPFDDLAITFDGFVARVWEIDPLDDRVALTKGEVQLRLLNVNRHTRKCPVLAAVIEMEMAVDDRAHRVRIELGVDQRTAYVAGSRSVVRLDPFVALTDPGIDQDEAIRVTDGKSQDRPVLPGERVGRGVGHVREMERDDVVRCHRPHRASLATEGPKVRPAGISRGDETLRFTDMSPSRRPSTLNVWLALGVVYVVWGSTYLAIAIAVQTLPPLFYSGIRFALAGLLLAAWLAFRRVDLRISRRELGGAAAVGILMLAGGNGLVNLGERTVPSGVAALIVASIPLWIVVYRMIARERVGMDLLAGVLLGLVGVAILVVPGGLNGTIDPIGALMLFGATLSWALGTFLSPRVSTPRNALVSTTYQMLAGGVALMVVAPLRGELAQIDPATFSAQSLIAFAYLVVFGSLIAYSAYTWLLQNASVSLVSTYAFVNPVVAVLLGALVLAEPITPTIVIGAAVIVVAVAFIVFRQNAARRAERVAPVAEAAD
jgi:drug/metabolite transporter (DMT)-like permease